MHIKKINMTVIILNRKNSRVTGLNQKLIAIIEALLKKICQEWNIILDLSINSNPTILQFFSN